MNVTETNLKGVLILTYDEKYDNRGYKYNNFSKDELAQHGIIFDCVEETMYCPEKAGTLYGIHFQNNPAPQSKILYCIKGRGLDYAIDLRKDSPTYLEWASVELSEKNHKQIYIPKGFGHVFLSLEDDTKVVMRIDEYFNHNYSRQIAWDDEQINIQYPVENPILAWHDVIAPKLFESDLNL